MTTMINLRSNQKEVLKLLRSGSVLWGGVGSGKSITGLYYYFVEECKGIIKNGRPIKMNRPKDLYIITTAKKRNTAEWEQECGSFLLTTDSDSCIGHVNVTIDSWNNIKKYADVQDAFFLFDEDKVTGYGEWARTFIKIAHKNHWLVLTATPGDTWMDYMAVFIANGFYKNKTDFTRQHVIYNPRVGFSKVDRYVNCHKLVKLKHQVVIKMNHVSPAEHMVTKLNCSYDQDLYKMIVRKNWNIFNDTPIVNAAECCYTSRRLVNSDTTRIDHIRNLIETSTTNRFIIFYNFDYELEILRGLSEYFNDYTVAEYNGHHHDKVPQCPKWIYLVQYTSGCEGWNCIETDSMIFYSVDYSYKKMCQAAGRIDRQNTPFKILHYYLLTSDSSIDKRILKAVRERRTFNENDFVIEEGLVFDSHKKQRI